jgi:hypothetical protein
MDDKIIFWVWCARCRAGPVAAVYDCRGLPVQTPAEEDLGVPGQSRLGFRIRIFAVWFLTKNFNSVLGEVAIRGDDCHTVKLGRGDDKPICGIAMVPWEAVGLKSDTSGNFMDPEVMVCDDLLKPSLGLFWKLQLASGGLETDFPSAYR